MTTPRLKRSLAVLSICILAGGAIIAWQATNLSMTSLFPSLPSPNGYDDFLKASALLTGRLTDLTNSNAEMLRSVVQQNQAALDLVRAGLQRDSLVTLQFTTNYLTAHMNELAGFKDLARLMVAAGAVAEVDRKFGECAQAYRDVIRFAYATAKGGLVIDVLAAKGIQLLGVKNLHRLREHLSATECRDLLQLFEDLERASEPMEILFLRERPYFRKVHGWWYTTAPRLIAIFARVDPLEKAQQETESSILRGQAQIRLLRVSLALHSFELEHGRYPASLAELVPKYISTLPNDPFSAKDFVYRLETPSYRLYSVGPNRNDDGGVPLGARVKGQLQQGDVILD